MSAPTAASHTLPLRNCYWVVPGLLLAGEHPNGPTRDKTKDRLKRLLAAGIECFVDLTKPTELLRYDTFLPFYVEYSRHPIKDHGLPGARSQMTGILEHIANSLRAGRPVYVHCRAGIGRTGTVVGCFLAERGVQGNAAVDELNRLWQQCRRSRSWPFIPETEAQAHYVREWQPSLVNGFELSSFAIAAATVGPMTADAGIRGATAGVADSAVGADWPSRGVGQDGGAAGLSSGAPMARAGRTGAAGRGTGGLRAAAEKARAAVERGDVQATARPVPTSTAGPTATAGARRGRAPTQNDVLESPRADSSLIDAAGSVHVESPPTGGASSLRVESLSGGAGSRRDDAPPSGGPSPRRVESRTSGEASSHRANSPEQLPGPANIVGGAGRSPPGLPKSSLHNDLERGEISPSIRAEIADAIAGRNPSPAASATPTPFPDARETAATDDGGDVSRAQTGVLPPAARRPPPSSRSRTKGEVTDTAPGRQRPMDVGAPPEDPHTSPKEPGASTTPGTAAGARGTVADRPSLNQGGDSDPLLDPDTLAAARSLRERFVGTLFGLAVGDAVAAATQFRRPGTFSPIGDMLGGGPFDLPRGAWSDDTAMALCLADSLLERAGFDARDQVQRYSRWQQDGYLSSTGQCVGITANTARSLALAKWRRGLVFPGSHDPEQLHPEPLSRVASIALFHFASLETTLLRAADAARITCQAPTVLDACRRLARALHAALSGQPKTKILAESGLLTEAAAQTNTSAASALAAALWAFSSTDNFRDAVLRAANVGGNSDVVAAVCGQLAGAHYGATAIPQAWRSGLIHKDLVEGYADRLLAQALVSLSS